MYCIVALSAVNNSCGVVVAAAAADTKDKFVFEDICTYFCF